MALLEVDNLSAAPYGEPLLSDIGFTLEAGAVLGLMGPNGAGKSTLLHALAGGFEGSAGEARLAGRAVCHWPANERARCLAMQGQHSGLNFPFTVEEVVLLGRLPHASGRAVDGRIVEEVMAATDTLSLRRRPYTRLSGGEKQRVQLARAIAQVWRAQDAPVRLLLLDEPNSALDLAHQRMVGELARLLAADGAAVVLATHDFNQLSAKADALLVLRDGTQHSYGAPAEVVTPALFAEVFDSQVIVQAHPVTGAPLVIQA